MSQENLGPNPPSLMISANDVKRYVLKKETGVSKRKLSLTLFDKGKKTLLQKGDAFYYYPQCEKLEILRLCEEDEANYHFRRMKIRVKIPGINAIHDDLRFSADSVSAFLWGIAVSMGFILEETSNSPELQIFRLI